MLGNPANGIDPYGLATILGRPSDFSAGRAWAIKYKDLIDANLRMKDDLKKVCPKDRARLQQIFDNWKINIDPNIDNIYKRARGQYAITNRSNQVSQFNFGFFNQDVTEPGAYFVFLHEFRHLMAENPSSNSDTGAEFAGRPARSPGENDADAWAKKFIDPSCVCGY